MGVLKRVAFVAAAVFAIGLGLSDAASANSTCRKMLSECKKKMRDVAPKESRPLQACKPVRTCRKEARKSYRSTKRDCRKEFRSCKKRCGRKGRRACVYECGRAQTGCEGDARHNKRESVRVCKDEYKGSCKTARKLVRKKRWDRFVVCAALLACMGDENNTGGFR